MKYLSILGFALINFSQMYWKVFEDGTNQFALAILTMGFEEFNQYYSTLSWELAPFILKKIWKDSWVINILFKRLRIISNSIDYSSQRKICL